MVVTPPGARESWWWGSGPGTPSLPPLPAVTSGRTKNARLVVLVLCSTIETVWLPPDTVRLTELVRPALLGRLFSPVRLAYVWTAVMYQLLLFPNVSGLVEYQYTLLLTTAPVESFNCNRSRYVVDSPDTAGRVSTCVEALAVAATGADGVYAWLRFGRL